MIHKNPQPMTAPGNGHDIVDGASRDQLLDKQLVFYQWRHGYRTAVDGLLVGAMVDSHARAVLDAGAGAGAVSLAAAYWQYQARQAQKNSGQRDGDDQVVAGVIHAVERNGDYFRLLEKNLWQENGWLGGKERFKLYHQPLHDFANGQQKKYHHQQPAPVDKGRDGVGTIAFDHILFNPPFDRATTSTAPPDDLKKQAMVFAPGEDITVWLAWLLPLVRGYGCGHPSGRLSFIIRPQDQQAVINFFGTPMGDRDEGGMATVVGHNIVQPRLLFQPLLAVERIIRLLVDVSWVAVPSPLERHKKKLSLGVTALGVTAIEEHDFQAHGMQGRGMQAQGMTAPVIIQATPFILQEKTGDKVVYSPAADNILRGKILRGKILRGKGSPLFPFSSCNS